MRTMWIGGKSSNLRPGGVTRLGPANPTGLARSDQCGSVRTLTPSSWTRSVEWRSEEHTSELQSQSNLVCRLLLEKKKKKPKHKSLVGYDTELEVDDVV